MILKSISLDNIRSYNRQRLDFNQGITVLSGDIGAGKSTILLAIEFALFGLTTQDSGTSLLRKGATDGSVELTFSVDNKDITIQRFLKKKSEGIRQMNGAIVVDGTKKDMTPIELKQAIISLLGYPQESLTKKSTIYRYTTYTPQDEMKHIMYEDAEERLNTIRKTFGIDKYRRIIENTNEISRVLRESKRELQGKTSDLEMKKNELQRIHVEKEMIILKEEQTAEKLTIAKQKTEQEKRNVAEAESALREILILKKEAAILAETLKQKQEQHEKIRQEIEKSQNTIAKTKQEISAERIEHLKKLINKNLIGEIEILEQKYMQLQRQSAEHEAHKKHSENIQNQIASLNDCPLCLQTVPHEHKESIKQRESEKTKQHSEMLTQLREESSNIKKQVQEKKKSLEIGRDAEKELIVMQKTIQHITEQESAVLVKQKQHETLIQEITQLQEKQKIMVIPSTEEQERRYAKAKQLYESALNEERNHEREYIKAVSEKNGIQRMEVSLSNEITEKEKSKNKLNQITNTENWLQNNFTKLMGLMEKHVLGKIYFTFNDEFKRLFGLMIDDEQLQSGIDESFTPKIEQNGYQTEFASLSGGEKTSVSLAFRLALHTSITKILTHMNSAGLIMLDEPTDGFSEEQLDSMKDIFDAVQAQQTIIVSHESKIESIADHVVRIAKNGHESIVL